MTIHSVRWLSSFFLSLFFFAISIRQRYTYSISPIGKPIAMVKRRKMDLIIWTSFWEWWSCQRPTISQLFAYFLSLSFSSSVCLFFPISIYLSLSLVRSIRLPHFCALTITHSSRSIIQKCFDTGSQWVWMYQNPYVCVAHWIVHTL